VACGTGADVADLPSLRKRGIDVLPGLGSARSNRGQALAHLL
jgi:hypothetical protein